MTEDKVWEQATKVWEKRKKIKNFNGISVIQLNDTREWVIDIANDYFGYTTQVRRFLDGLETP